MDYNKEQNEEEWWQTKPPLDLLRANWRRAFCQSESKEVAQFGQSEIKEVAQ